MAPFSDIDWNDIDQVVDRLQDATCDQRAELLARIESKNPALAARIARLLVFLDDETEFMERGIPDLGLTDHPHQIQPGTRIGAYRVLQPLGAGGMGEVYLAERADGSFDQQVAIKVLTQRLQGPAKARFELERQLLASLEHPGISRLIDGGELDTGEPFLAMELIDGQPIDQYCDQVRLNVRKRIQLVMQVCEALDFAHRNRVIHRDIKPANVMVDQEGRTRLLDFGIAKLAADDAFDQKLTQDGVPMTPAYASPEQARGLTITTSSDIYSLGAVLYELVVGTSPIVRTASDDVVTILTSICEQPPRRFTAALRKADEGERLRLALARSSSIRSWQRDCNRDLEAIVLKTLAKEPERRYASVASLRDDLQRYLDGRPVHAQPDSAWYRFNRLAARHPLASALSASALVALITLTVGLAVQLRQTERQRIKAEQTTQFLVNMFEQASPQIAGASDVRAIDVLHRASYGLKSELSDQPLLRAELLDVISSVQRYLHDSKRGEQVARSSLEIKKRLLGDQHPDLIPTLTNLGAHLVLQGDPEEGRQYLRRAEDLINRHQLGGTEAAMDLRTIQALSQQIVGDLQNAQGNYLSIINDTADPNSRHARHRETALLNLGWLRLNEGDLKDSKTYLDQALQERIKRYGENHPLTLVCRIGALEWLTQAEQTQAATELANQLIDQITRDLGADSSELASVLLTKAELLQHRGAIRQAQQQVSQAKDIIRDKYSPLSDSYLDVLIRESDMLLQTHLLEESRTTAEQAVQLASEYDGRPDFKAIALSTRAAVLSAQGYSTDAETDYREALNILAQAYSSSYPVALKIKTKLAWLLVTSRRSNMARELYEMTLPVISQQKGPDSPSLHALRTAYAWSLYGCGKSELAITTLDDALTQLLRLQGTQSAEVATAQHSLGWMVFEQGQIERAMQLTKQAIATRTNLLGTNHPSVAWSQNNLAIMLYRHKDYQAAAELMTQAYEIRRDTLGESHQKTLESGASCLIMLIESRADELALQHGRELIAVCEEFERNDLLVNLYPAMIELADRLSLADEKRRWQAQLSQSQAK